MEVDRLARSAVKWIVLTCLLQKICLVGNVGRGLTAASGFQFLILQRELTTQIPGCHNLAHKLMLHIILGTEYFDVTQHAEAKK